MVDPTAFLRTPDPGINQGMMQGLAAASMGQQAATAQRKDQLSQQANNLSQSAVESWKQKDMAGFQNKLRQLSAIDPKAAQELQKTFQSLNWQNLVETGYRVFAAASSPDRAARDKLLDQSIDTLSAGPDHWMTQGLQRMKTLDDKEQTQELLGSVEMLKTLGVFPKEAFGGTKAKSQKTGAFLIEDANGNKKVVTGIFNPNDDSFKMGEAELPAGYKLISNLGETADEQTKRRIDEVVGKEKASEAIKASTAFANQYEQVQKNMITFDEGIAIIQEGLQKGENLGVGPIRKYLPKWNETAAKLQNISNRLGLDVVSSVTFGALSEAEMKMAMTTAVPSNLSGPDLLQWMTDKRDAQAKLSEYLKEASLFIGSERPDGGINTVQDWMRLGKSRRGQTLGQTPGQMSGQQTGQMAPEQMEQPAQNLPTVNRSNAAQYPTFGSIEEGEQSGQPYFIVGGTLYQN